MAKEKKAVAALVYFGEGATVAEVERILLKLQVELDRAKGPTTLQSAIVDSYNPEWGSPVWYIP